MRGDRKVEGVECLSGGMVVNRMAKSKSDQGVFPLEISL